MSELHWWERDKGLKHVFETSSMIHADSYEQWEPYLDDLEPESVRALNQHFQIQVLNGYPDTICAEFMKTINVKTPKEYKHNFLLYRNGIWIEEPPIVIETRLYDYLRRCYYWKGMNGKGEQKWIMDQKGITTLASAVLRILRSNTLCSIKEFNTRKDAIPVLNGVLDFSDINNIKLEQHSIYNHFTYKINAAYSPKVDWSTSRMNSFVGEMLSAPPKSEEKQEIDKKILLMHVGELLMANPSIYSKTPILVGETRSGKTQFMEALRAFVGHEYSMNHTLQDFQKIQYAISDLEHKLYNFYSDLPYSSTLFEIDKIKVITDPILSGDKKFESWRIFYNTCKHFYGANGLPPLNQNSKAFQKRFNIIECGVNYTKKDENLLQKITTPKELTCMLNMAILGLQMLKKNGGHLDQDIDEIWEVKSNSLRYYIENYCEEHSSNTFDHVLPIDLLLEEYNKFLKKESLDVLSNGSQLSRELGKLGYETKRMMDDRDRKRKSHVLGLEFRDSL